MMITLRSLLIAAVVATSLPAAAQSPRWLRLSYAAGDAATSVTITWTADAAMNGARVRYGASSAYGLEALVTTTPDALPGGLGVVHEVTLTGLQPNTRYHYSAGTDGAWSADAHFTTTPADGCTPLRFAALGDGRSQDSSGADPKWDDILTEAWAHEPRFVVDTGDLIHDGDQASQWVNWLTNTAAVNPFLPHMPSIGNHDNDAVEGDQALYNRIFALPRNSATQTEDFYAFTAGNAVFAVLSSQTYSDDSFVQQAAWLDQTLTTHADKLWKFVILHHPIFTSHAEYFGVEFNHPPNERNQNAALLPVIDRHHVDIVFAGHNHYYERFTPLRGGTSVDQGVVAGDFAAGTVYVITGGAGAFTYDEFDLFGLQIDLINWLCGTSGLKATGSEACSGKHHYLILDLDDNVLTFTAHTSTLQNFGSETPWVIETFQIVKPPTGACVTPPDGGPDGAANEDGAPQGDPTPTDAGGDAAEAPPPEGTPDGGCACASRSPGGYGLVALWWIAWRRRRALDGRS